MKHKKISRGILALTVGLSLLMTEVSCSALDIAFSTNKNNNSASSEAPSWLNTATPTPAPTATTTPSGTPDPNATPMLAATASPTPTSSTTVTSGTKDAEVLKVPILLYHHISDEITSSNAISVISPKDFKLHMTAIKAQFTPISLREYVEFVNTKDNAKTLPKNPIIITFDDGYLSNYEIAYPILKELEIPATIFVVTDTVGAKAGEGKVNNSHFTWEQAKEMSDSGIIDIQSHTNDHLKLATVSMDIVNFELRKSKYLIEKNLGKTCDMIAYPYGSYTDSIIMASKKAGYATQCLVGDDATTIDYEVNMPRDGVEHLTRITVSGLMGNVNVLELIRKAMSNKTT